MHTEKPLTTVLIVDTPQRGVLAALPQLSAILIVDNLADVSPAPHVRLIERPFTAEQLLAEIGRDQR